MADRASSQTLQAYFIENTKVQMPNRLESINQIVRTFRRLRKLVLISYFEIKYNITFVYTKKILQKWHFNFSKTVQILS